MSDLASLRAAREKVDHALFVAEAYNRLHLAIEFSVNECREVARALAAALSGASPAPEPDGVLRGADAEAVRHEILHGTPNTPERVERIQEADRIYRRVRPISGEPDAETVDRIARATMDVLAFSEDAPDRDETVRRVQRDLARSARLAPTPEPCDYCDGCGWVEGGTALKTTCPRCKGTCVVPPAAPTAATPDPKSETNLRVMVDKYVPKWEQPALYAAISDWHRRNSTLWRDRNEIIG